MSLALLRDAVRAEVQNGVEKSSGKSVRRLTKTEQQAVRAMRRQMRAAGKNRDGMPIGITNWWI